MFKSAIVKKPCKNFSKGLTTSSLGLPDYQKVLEQHENYIKTLRKCGLKVHILEADEEYPDSTFVEDIAIVNEKCVIITNPGAQSRKGEVQAIFDFIKDEYNFEKIERIEAPGTLDGGDIMRIDKCYYIGLSSRTNQEGADQLAKILAFYGFRSQVVKMKETLHLKSGLNYIGNKCLLSIDEFKNDPLFQEYDIIHVEKDEEYAANCIIVNGNVIMPKGYNKLKENLTKLNYIIIELEMSEFKKMDGGLSCLSLRFP
ncbi:dimethylarginine dimethylaminohydrolase family protein [Promethearchaeum syntrophicum]|uniref:Dimethylarginine dimethylaminohydrolase family protein n=1 Tax=Promethearchaeum syntrophicum TaxID=2594042 RepID=A0A5B9DFW4_9ARCH|nr:arginine deiminase family protein [Candidatus Prometheoarchaeum syntrophicum]QEE17911.1 Arginine deiminase [Candidatus Prometheoarchaeum syntrophicum]